MKSNYLNMTLWRQKMAGKYTKVAFGSYYSKKDVNLMREDENTPDLADIFRNFDLRLKAIERKLGISGESRVTHMLPLQSSESREDWDIEQRVRKFLAQGSQHTLWYDRYISGELNEDSPELPEELRKKNNMRVKLG